MELADSSIGGEDGEVAWPLCWGMGGAWLSGSEAGVESVSIRGRGLSGPVAEVLLWGGKDWRVDVWWRAFVRGVVMNDRVVIFLFWS